MQRSRSTLAATTGTRRRIRTLSTPICWPSSKARHSKRRPEAASCGAGCAARPDPKIIHNTGRSIVMRASTKALCAAAALLGIGAVALNVPARTQTMPAPPSSVLPTGGGKALFDTSDVAILLLDHQAGLFQTVKDISITELRSNTVMLAKLATLLKIPVITTASEPG